MAAAEGSANLERLKREIMGLQEEIFNLFLPLLGYFNFIQIYK